MVKSLLSRLRELGESLGAMEAPWSTEAPHFGAGFENAKLSALGLPDDLPEDYVEFLSEVGEIVAMSVHSGYHLISPEVATDMAGQDGLPNVAQDELLWPVATNGGGAMFFIGCGGEGRIWKWRHGENPVMVAATFTEFLRRIVADWEHFLEDDRSWPYLSQ